MARSEFDDFIDRQQAKKDGTPDAFDPKKQLEEWRAYLEQLYKTIEQYMAPYIDKKAADIIFRDVELNEEFSGIYIVKEMLLNVGISTVVFKPVGTMLIGSKGRVDVHGPRGTSRLALINRKVGDARQMVQVNVSINGVPSTPKPKSNEPIDWAWKIVTPNPQMRFFELTENNFFDMILSVADA